MLRVFILSEEGSWRSTDGGRQVASVTLGRVGKPSQEWDRTMSYSESEVKQALGIETWRNLSKDKVLELVALMPQIDEKVALSIIEQLPELTKFALEALDGLEERHEATLAHNERSQEHVHQGYQEVREILKGELDNENLTWEQRKQIYDLLMATVRLQSEKDTENKQLLDSWYSKVTVGTVAALAVVVIAIGGKVDVKAGVKALLDGGS
jgi:hypothetical protein